MVIRAHRATARQEWDNRRLDHHNPLDDFERRCIFVEGKVVGGSVGVAGAADLVGRGLGVCFG